MPNVDRITVNPEVLHGKASVRGMRIGVGTVLAQLAGGRTRQQILEDFPYLEDEDITACLWYVADKENRVAEFDRWVEENMPPEVPFHPPSEEQRANA